MQKREWQKSFELKATSQYGAINEKPLSSEIEFWLQRGIEKFIKTRFSGVNSKRLSYEQDQKRIEDLRSLKKYDDLIKISDSDYMNRYKKYEFSLPDDYLITTGETVTLLPLSLEAMKCWDIDDDGFIPYHTTLIECTDDNIDEKLSNKLSDYRFHGKSTKPLRVHDNNTVSVFTDGNYSINKFQLTYLRKPIKFELHINPSQEYSEFPEHACDEIINLAVQLYLENKGKERYKTFPMEVSTME